MSYDFIWVNSNPADIEKLVDELVGNHWNRATHHSQSSLDIELWHDKDLNTLLKIQGLHQDRFLNDFQISYQMRPRPLESSIILIQDNEDPVISVFRHSIWQEICSPSFPWYAMDPNKLKEVIKTSCLNINEQTIETLHLAHQLEDSKSFADRYLEMIQVNLSGLSNSWKSASSIKMLHKFNQLELNDFVRLRAWIISKFKQKDRSYVMIEGWGHCNSLSNRQILNWNLSFEPDWKALDRWISNQAVILDFSKDGLASDLQKVKSHLQNKADSDLLLPDGSTIYLQGSRLIWEWLA